MRRVCFAVLVCVCVGAGLTGCESEGPAPFRGGCGQPSVRHAWALEVTTAGRVRWETPLATHRSGDGASLSPLAVGTVAAFVQDDVVYGLRLADGHRLWSWASPQSVERMWRWRGLVIVLAVQQAGSREMARLAGLDASTGQVRWTLRVPGYILDEGVTPDGGLAMIRADGVLEVVDLSGGRVRWARPAGFPAGQDSGSMPWAMAVAPGMVIFAVNGRLTSYDDRTGPVRWSEALMPVQLAERGSGELSLHVYAGLVYLTAVQQRTGELWTPVLLVISAANGRLKWRYTANPPVSLAANASGLISITPNSGGTWLYDLDPATGRVRWRADSGYPAVAPQATSDGIVTGSSQRQSGTDDIRMRDALTGANRCTVRLSRLIGGGNLSVFPAGPLVVVAAGSANRPDDVLAAFRITDGHREWEITMPAQVAAPLSAVPGGILIDSATVVHPCE